MNVSLGKNLEDFVAEQVENGDFNNQSEVVRDALRREKERLAQIEYIRFEVEKGLASAKAGNFSDATLEDIKREALSPNASPNSKL